MMIKIRNILPLLGLVGSTQASLVAHYDMEAIGSPLTDQAGGQTATAVDSGQSYGVAGPAGFGNAVSLSGNGSWQISAAASQEIDLANNFSVASWVYIDSAILGTKSGTNSSVHRIIGDDVEWDRDGWSFGLFNSTMRFTKNGVIDADDSSATAVPLDQWVHLAATVDSTAGVTFYLNGAVTGTNGNTADNFTGTGNNGLDDPYAIGRSYGNGQEQWFPGSLDEVRVYDNVLTSTEIAALVVPEPSSALLGFLGMGLVLRRRR
ncbi:LamG-like jellyroll fold domain-containing protein [Verrucomicrobiaceae bacterium 227]